MTSLQSFPQHRQPKGTKEGGQFAGSAPPNQVSLSSSLSLNETPPITELDHSTSLFDVNLTKNNDQWQRAETLHDQQFSKTLLSSYSDNQPSIALYNEFLSSVFSHMLNTGQMEPSEAYSALKGITKLSLYQPGDTPVPLDELCRAIKTTVVMREQIDNAPSVTAFLEKLAYSSHDISLPGINHFITGTHYKNLLAVAMPIENAAFNPADPDGTLAFDVYRRITNVGVKIHPESRYNSSSGELMKYVTARILISSWKAHHAKTPPKGEPLGDFNVWFKNKAPLWDKWQEGLLTSMSEGFQPDASVAGALWQYIYSHIPQYLKGQIEVWASRRASQRNSVESLAAWIPWHHPTLQEYTGLKL